jgi:hypothetical protein
VLRLLLPRGTRLTFSKDDWRAQAVNSTVSEADVDNNYQKIVDQGKNNFTTHGGVVLTHQSSASNLVTGRGHLAEVFHS